MKRIAVRTLTFGAMFAPAVLVVAHTHWSRDTVIIAGWFLGSAAEAIVNELLPRTKASA